MSIGEDGAGRPAASRLAGLTQAQRDQALARWQALRAHVEDGRPLIRAAADAGVPERTLRRWLAAYRDGGLPALARRHLGWGDYEGMANLYGT